MTQPSNTFKDFGFRDAYKAAIEGDLDTLLKFCILYSMAPINASGDTVFHILALNSHAKVFIELLHKMPSSTELMMVANEDGDTALHKATRVGCLEIADHILEKETNLITACNKLGETPIFGAAAFGQEKMLRFLSEKPDCKNGLTRNDGSTILHAAVMGEFYGLALVIMESFPDLVMARNVDGITALHLLAQSPTSFRSGTIYSWVNLGSRSFISLVFLAITIYSCISKDVHLFDKEDSGNPGDSGCTVIRWRSHNLPLNYWLRRTKQLFIQALQRLPLLKEVVAAKQKHKDALELVKQLVARESKHSRLNCYENNGEDHFENSSVYHLQLNKNEAFLGQNCYIDPLLQATKCGIIEVVQVILEEFPDAIDVVDEHTGKNILHLVAEYRRDIIFEFLRSKYMNGPIAQLLVKVDKELNTPLHLAAKYGFYQQRHVLPVLHEMPWELLWFKHIRNLSPPQTYHLRNKEGKTPKEVFDETHKDLLQKSEKCGKENIVVFMVIAVLIATLMFTSGLTVPGGFDPNSGLPVFDRYQKKLTATYLLFVEVSLGFSLGTLAIALHIYSSCFQPEDFAFSLPLAFVLCSSTLFVSVIFTSMAYQAASLLVEGGKFTHIYGRLGRVGIVIEFLLVSLVYLDVVFPTYRFLIQVLCQSLFRQKWESIN